MGCQGRDDRQMKAFTGVSQAPFDALLPVFSALDQATPRQRDAEGRRSGRRRRKPGGDTQGTWPTRAEKVRFVRSYDTT